MTGMENEHRIDAGQIGPLTAWSTSTFAVFLWRQAAASAFGGLMLVGIILTRAIWQDDWPFARYDVLFLYALALQAVFLLFKLETLAEARVILLFHLTGTLMEWFKVSQGSWHYPEEALFEVMGVPLFSGFMYAAVGSYIARAIRLFDMRFSPYPPHSLALSLGLLIYLNFFSHHFLPDMRWLLFAATLALFARTRVWFHLGRWFWMPMPLAAALAAFALWVAESVGTITGTWLYSGQSPGTLASPAKMGSWYLLLWVSFVTVTLVLRAALLRERWHPPAER